MKEERSTLFVPIYIYKKKKKKKPWRGKGRKTFETCNLYQSYTNFPVSLDFFQVKLLLNMEEKTAILLKEKNVT